VHALCSKAYCLSWDSDPTSKSCSEHTPICGHFMVLLELKKLHLFLFDVWDASLPEVQNCPTFFPLFIIIIMIQTSSMRSKMFGSVYV
jgi:hypothetical protein